MPEHRRIPVHSFGQPYDFEDCGEWPGCGCLRACKEIAEAPRRAARRFRLLVLLGCVVPTFYAAFLFLSQWSAR